MLWQRTRVHKATFTMSKKTQMFVVKETFNIIVNDLDVKKLSRRSLKLNSL